MTGFEDFVISYLVNAAWQAPLVVGAAWCAARLARAHGPAVQHRIWVAALLIEAGLPPLPHELIYVASAVRSMLAALSPNASSGGSVSIAFGPVTASPTGVLLLPAAARNVVFSVYVATVLFFAMRLVWRVWNAERLLQRAYFVELPHGARARWRKLQGDRSGGRAATRAGISASIASPIAVGMLRPALLFPTGFVEQATPEDLDAVLGHESAHLLRRDLLKNLLYQAIALPIAWHPVVALTQARISETREMVCDQFASEALESRERYAHSLVRLAGMFKHNDVTQPFHAIGILGANTLERRVMKLTETIHAPGRIRRFATLAACGLIAAATCSSALALRLNVEAPRGAAAVALLSQLKIEGGVMAEQVLKKTQPVYPVQAKADKNIVDGPVVLDAIIGKDGKIEKLTVLKSLRADYDKSALDAVRDWEYKPYLLNGEPTEVETTITVTYSHNP